MRMYLTFNASNPVNTFMCTTNNRQCVRQSMKDHIVTSLPVPLQHNVLYYPIHSAFLITTRHELNDWLSADNER